MITEPTEEGKLRYPPDGYYEGDCKCHIPCTCTSECRNPCKGECGCEACRAEYVDFGDD